jgi:hypothetical protein
MIQIKKSVTKEILGKQFRNFLWFSIFEKECVRVCINFLRVPPTKNHTSVTLPSCSGHVIKLEINECLGMVVTIVYIYKIMCMAGHWQPHTVQQFDSTT